MYSYFGLTCVFGLLFLKWLVYRHPKHHPFRPAGKLDSLDPSLCVRVWGLEKELTRLRTMAIAMPTEGLNGVLAATGARTAEHMKELLKKDVVNRNEWSSKTVGFCVQGIPSWELIYPLSRHFWRWCSFSPGGIWTRSLEGKQNQLKHKQ